MKLHFEPEVIPTEDGLGYWVVLGTERTFTSSMHLVDDKIAQLRAKIQSNTPGGPSDKSFF